MHDRIAELRGLRAELDNAQNGPRRAARKDAVDGITQQIERVRGELADEADRLDAEAGEFTDKGQDGLAGDRAVAARAIRAALSEDDPAPAKSSRAPGGKRTAAAAKAPEQT